MKSAAVALLFVASLLTSSYLVAQARSDPAAATPSLQFDGFAAVSIRPSATSQNGYTLRTYSGRLTVTGITAKRLIGWAYNLEPFQITGGPAWASRDGFDITAVTDDATAASQAAEGSATRVAMIQLMTREMLKTRFGLVFHTETTSRPTYELSLAGPMTTANHPGLQSHTPDSHPNTEGANVPGAYNVTMTNVPISSLAKRLEDYLQTPVVDKTDLPGIFDITLRWYGDSDMPAEGGDDLQGSLKRNLNLQIQRVRAPVATLVIEKMTMPSQD